MVNSLSLVLVVVAAVTLGLGWFQDGLALVYVSIATCLVALALIAFDRVLRRRTPVPATTGHATAPTAPAAPDATEATATPVTPAYAAASAELTAASVAAPTGTGQPAASSRASSSRASSSRASSSRASSDPATPSRSLADLEQVRGLGPAKRAALLDRFGSVDAIAAASAEELTRTPGIGAGLARAIEDQLA